MHLKDWMQNIQTHKDNVLPFSMTSLLNWLTLHKLLLHYIYYFSARDFVSYFTGKIKSYLIGDNSASLIFKQSHISVTFSLKKYNMHNVIKVFFFFVSYCQVWGFHCIFVHFSSWIFLYLEFKESYVFFNLINFIQSSDLIYHFYVYVSQKLFFVSDFSLRISVFSIISCLSPLKFQHISGETTFLLKSFFHMLFTLHISELNRSQSFFYYATETMLTSVSAYLFQTIALGLCHIYSLLQSLSTYQRYFSNILLYNITFLLKRHEDT